MERKITKVTISTSTEEDANRRPKLCQASGAASGMNIDINSNHGENREANKPELGRNDFRTAFLYSDVVFVVEEKELHAHRVMLSLWSPVFKAMFNSDCQESSTLRIILGSDDFESISLMLRLIYTPGGIELDGQKALLLLPLFHRYQIDILLAQCESRLCATLNDNTAVEYLKLAEIFQLTRLRQLSLDRCAKLHGAMLDRELQDIDVTLELQLEIYKRRVENLELSIRDIENSLTRSVSRMESKNEKIIENHCSNHTQPLSTLEAGFPCTACLEKFKNHVRETCKRAMNRPNVIILKAMSHQ